MAQYPVHFLACGRHDTLPRQSRGRASQRHGKAGLGRPTAEAPLRHCGSANVAAFGPLLKLVTSKQVLFGSDFPFTPAPAVRAAVGSLRTLGLSEEELRDIDGANARSLFQRFAK